MDDAAKTYLGQFGVVRKPSKDSQRRAALEANQQEERAKAQRHSKVSLGSILRKAGIN